MFKLLILPILLLAQAVHAQPAPAAAGSLYKEVVLRYTAYVADGDKVALYSLDPVGAAFDFEPRSKCAEGPKLGIGDVFDANRQHFNAADRLWVDWDAGIIGLQSKEGQYYFVRYICLPKHLIEDLYLFLPKGKGPPMETAPDKFGHVYLLFPDGTKKRMTGSHIRPKNAREIRENREQGWCDGICYDQKRFFERFEKYGVTPTFEVPDTKPREAWDSNAWNKTIFIFPLDGKNE